MATVKTIFRANLSGNSIGSLYFRVIHKRKVRQIHTGYRIFSSEWDEVHETVKYGWNPERLEYLKTVEAGLDSKLSRIRQIIFGLERERREYSVIDVVDKFLSPDSVAGFISFCRLRIKKCREIGRASAADHYVSTLNSFVRFYGDGELPFDEIDSALLSRYESSLKESGLCPNTISYYMRKLRALYNDAVEEGLTENRQPFKHVYTGVAKTRKRAIPLDAVKALKALDLDGKPLDAFARDVFLFSFYTRGTAPVDIAYMKKDSLQNGVLCYRRRKTSQALRIKWTAEMEDIVSRYGDSSSSYLLPLIKSADKDERRQYISAIHLINQHLKKLGQEIGLDEPLTLYVARHAWASIALSNNVPIGVISQGMGHDSERTTRIYIASLDSSALDKANEDIIGLLDG